MATEVTISSPERPVGRLPAWLCSFLVGAVGLAVGLPVQAAPVMPGPVCVVTGEVESVALREEAYQDESWRKSWGLPKSVIYTDVTIRVVGIAAALDPDLPDGAKAATLKKGCADLAAHNPFQLRPGSRQPRPGQYIRATTQFSGDEFAIGQWLYDIEILDHAICR